MRRARSRGIQKLSTRPNHRDDKDNVLSNHDPLAPYPSSWRTASSLVAVRGRRFLASQRSEFNYERHSWRDDNCPLLGFRGGGSYCLDLNHHSNVSTLNTGRRGARDGNVLRLSPSAAQRDKIPRKRNIWSCLKSPSHKRGSLPTRKVTFRFTCHLYRL